MRDSASRARTRMMDVASTKTAIVTGGSAGLGRVMVVALLQSGHNVAATGRNAQALDELRGAMTALGIAGSLLVVQADVKSPGDCETVVERTLSEFGTVDALVNNAAIALPTHLPGDNWKFWRDVSVDFWRELVDINVNGVFQMSRLVAPVFEAKGWGRIVNQVTSLRSMIRGGETPYGPSKAAVEAMTAAWAQEFEGTGITVNAIQPGGAADTGMILASAVPDRSVLIDPEVMAAPIRWLVSSRSDGVTSMRVTCSEWNPELSDEENVARSCEPAGWKPLLATMINGTRSWPPRASA